jgi:hypothetical protein
MSAGQRGKLATSPRGSRNGASTQPTSLPGRSSDRLQGQRDAREILSADATGMISGGLCGCHPPPLPRCGPPPCRIRNSVFE